MSADHGHAWESHGHSSGNGFFNVDLGISSMIAGAVNALTGGGMTKEILHGGWWGGGHNDHGHH